MSRWFPLAIKRTGAASRGVGQAALRCGRAVRRRPLVKLRELIAEDVGIE
jgi:hypothetical protein